MGILLLACMLLFCRAEAGAALLYVPAQYPDIQIALNAADDGDTVLVAPGIYRGPGNRNLDFRGKALALIGEAGASATLLDCEGRGRGFCFENGEGDGSVLCGFTVLSGSALGLGSGGKGAGVYCGGASPRIVACLFTGGEALFGGGLAAEWDARPALVGCVFTDNRAYLDGGAVFFFGGGGIWQDCVLRGNEAEGAGPDAYLCAAWPIMLRCRFDADPLPEGLLANP